MHQSVDNNNIRKICAEISAVATAVLETLVGFMKRAMCLRMTDFYKTWGKNNQNSHGNGINSIKQKWRKKNKCAPHQCNLRLTHWRSCAEPDICFIRLHKLRKTLSTFPARPKASKLKRWSAVYKLSTQYEFTEKSLKACHRSTCIQRWHDTSTLRSQPGCPTSETRQNSRSASSNIIR